MVTGEWCNNDVTRYSRVRAEESREVKYNVSVSKNKFECPPNIAEEVVNGKKADEEQPVDVNLYKFFKR